MQIEPFVTHRFVKNEDLNHHGSLYAPREADWFAEAGLMAAARYLPPKNVTFVKIHGMDFKRPVRLGETIDYEAKAVLAGTTSLTVHVEARVGGEHVSGGFITFVNVDEQGRKLPHGITLEPTCEEDAALQEQARNLPRD